MTQTSATFAGKTALVTGSGRNIGRAIALALAAGGANVVVNGHRDRKAVEKVAQDVEAAGGRALAAMADVSKHDEVASMLEHAAREFGSVDIVVSNVGLRRLQP